ncbi:hypothetical protein [Telluribacter humicola]|uniref:hypothetical protein n=1 Tax=Telluribacter humicola TaxID=1720261 RepID=UPI001A965B96|nr:hypothetical protein [Telluribacter humicola]
MSLPSATPDTLTANQSTFIMERPFVNNVEDFITKFVHSTNGQLVSEYLNSTPDFENADYFFKSDNIIIELKCLEKDLFSDEDFERNERLIDRWIEEKLITKSDIIAIFLRKKQIPEKCLQEMFKLARRTFQKVIEKANKQLRETKTKAGNADTKKVLMICNDGNYLFPNALLFSLVCDIISTRKEIDIDCTVYFTVNQVSFIPNSDLDWGLWLPAYGENANEHLHQFINDLGLKFNNFYNDTFGIENTEYRDFPDTEVGINAISEMNYIPKDVIYKQ